MKKIVTLLAMLVLMLSFCTFSVSAASGPVVEKVTRISEKGIMIEFSEDIIIDGRNPFFGLRFVNDKNELQYVNGQPLQYYNFSASVIDGRTILLTSEEGVASQMLDLKGQYAFYREYHLKLCIEELAPEGVDVQAEDTVYNIKSRATGIRMASEYGAGGLAGCYYDIVKDYNYFGAGVSTEDNMDDPNTVKPEEPKPEAENHTFVQGDVGTISVIHEGNNDNMIWAAMGIAAAAFVVGVIAVVVVLLTKKKAK